MCIRDRFKPYKLMRTNILLISILSLLLFSCNKENPITDPGPEADYTMIQTGQYWVYEFYKIDTTGAELKLECTDSAYILRDTLIGGVQYFIKISHPLVFTKSGEMIHPADTTILMDSTGTLFFHLYTGENQIIFSRDNYSDVLYSDTTGEIVYRELVMAGKDSVINVPAGSFVTRSALYNIYPLNPDYPWGIRKLYNVYGKNTGLIKYQYAFYSSPSYYEARLVRTGNFMIYPTKIK
jgi:hypothetical protein